MIPDEAVEAAVEALLGSKLGDHAGINGEEFVEAAHLALEAAAPHMAAQTLNEAAGALREATSWSGSKPGPDLIARWLQSRAHAQVQD